MTSVKKGRGRKPVHKDGLFDDLQDFSKGEISEKISSTKAGIEAGEKEIQRMHFQILRQFLLLVLVVYLLVVYQNLLRQDIMKLII